jgi:hypothetical protein
MGFQQRRTTSGSINKPGGSEAVSLKVAENYVEQFGKLAKESNTVLLRCSLERAGSSLAGGRNSRRGSQGGGEGIRGRAN